MPSRRQGNIALGRQLRLCSDPNHCSQRLSSIPCTPLSLRTMRRAIFGGVEKPTWPVEKSVDHEGGAEIQQTRPPTNTTPHTADLARSREIYFRTAAIAALVYAKIPAFSSKFWSEVPDKHDPSLLKHSYLFEEQGRPSSLITQCIWCNYTKFET